LKKYVDTIILMTSNDRPDRGINVWGERYFFLRSRAMHLLVG
jgi:hypothetical protein